MNRLKRPVFTGAIVPEGWGQNGDVGAAPTSPFVSEGEPADDGSLPGGRRRRSASGIDKTETGSGFRVDVTRGVRRRCLGCQRAGGRRVGHARAVEDVAELGANVE